MSAYGTSEKARAPGGKHLLCSREVPAGTEWRMLYKAQTAGSPALELWTKKLENPSFFLWAIGAGGGSAAECRGPGPAVAEASPRRRDLGRPRQTTSVLSDSELWRRVAHSRPPTEAPSERPGCICVVAAGGQDRIGKTKKDSLSKQQSQDVRDVARSSSATEQFGTLLFRLGAAEKLPSDLKAWL